MTPFIVAEVSKTWIDGTAESPLLLCERFERVIEVNRQRGYRLHSFTLHQLMTDSHQLVETIIAVFETVDASL